MMTRAGTMTLALSALTLLTAAPVALAPGHAEAREVRANMDRYCKSRHMKYLGYQRKKKRHACGVMSTGFNTYYVSKIEYINLTNFCSRYHKTRRWRFRGDAVWCLVTDPTILRLCNNRRETVNAAIASFVEGRRRRGDRGWVTTGWWVIEPGQCRTPGINPEYSGSVYIYGYTGTGEIAGNDAWLCVRSGKAFKLGNADNRRCRDDWHKRVGMFKFGVATGTNVWTFR